MAKQGAFRETWQRFRQKVKPFTDACAKVFRAIGNVFRVIGSWCYRFRKPLMAAPVVLASGYLAQYNYENLPGRVGIGLLESGSYAQMVTKEAAVLCPLAVTGLCLVLMFCSRKTTYPWIISIFSLVLPVLILLTNLYPA